MNSEERAKDIEYRREATWRAAIAARVKLDTLPDDGLNFDRASFDAVASSAALFRLDAP